MGLIIYKIKCNKEVFWEIFWKYGNFLFNPTQLTQPKTRKTRGFYGGFLSLFYHFYLTQPKTCKKKT